VLGVWVAVHQQPHLQPVYLPPSVILVLQLLQSFPVPCLLRAAVSCKCSCRGISCSMQLLIEMAEPGTAVSAGAALAATWHFAGKQLTPHQDQENGALLRGGARRQEPAQARQRLHLQ
jgi:hypothetical protein